MAEEAAARCLAALEHGESTTQEDFGKELAAVAGDAEKLSAFTKALCASAVDTGGRAVKITFVVGGGKKNRGRYADSLPKQFMAELSSASYLEDRGASACAECMGSFKFQHDTDKDLKFVHVFPRFVVVPDAHGGARADGAARAPAAEGGGEAARCYACDVDEFRDIILVRDVVSFSQRKALLRLLKERSRLAASLFERLSVREALSEGENCVVEGSSDLDEKVGVLQAALEQMMAGKLTDDEKKSVLHDLDAKAKALEEAAGGDGAKAKRAEKQLAMLREKRRAVSESETVAARPLRFEKELRELYKQVARIEKLEKSKQLQTVAVIKEINTKPEIEERIAALESKCKGWFMDAAFVDGKLKALRAAAAKAPPQSRKGGGGADAARSAGGGAGGGFTAVARGKGARNTASGSSRQAAYANAFDLLS